MKTHYATLLFWICAAVTQAQSIEFPAANINAHLTAYGTFFHNTETQSSGFEAPAGSGIHAIFGSGIWIGGIDENNTLRLAAHQYCPMLSDQPCDFTPGPLSGDGIGTWSQEFSDRYGGITLVTADQIEESGVYWDCVKEPGCDPNFIFPNGYVIPPNFYNWPAYADTTLETGKNLAPFLDFNGDGIYNPDHGDRPQICGDIAAYTIFNDNAYPHGESSGEPIGLEVHAMMYAYYDSGDAADNTVFLKIKLINRGPHTLHDTYAGMWTSIELGNYLNDYIGSDVQRSMFYAYNATENDPTTQFVNGYGDDLGVIGIRILSGVTADPDGMDGEAIPAPYTTYGNKTTGWGDGIPDNERLGMSSLIHHHLAGMTLPPITTPSSDSEFYYGLRGLWLVGNTMTVGGFGFNPGDPFAVPTKYAFFGESDPLLWATDGIQPADSNWTQAAFGPMTLPAIQSSGPFTFAPGAIQHIDYAVIFARDSHNPDEDPLTTLRAYADEAVTMTCPNLPDVVSQTESSQNDAKLLIFPNPSSDFVTLFIRPASDGTYTVFDLSGRKVASGTITDTETQIEVNGFAQGMYIVAIETANTQTSRKLLVGN